MKQHQSEVLQGQRFEFGDNWRHFLEVLNEECIGIAEKLSSFTTLYHPVKGCNMKHIYL